MCCAIILSLFSCDDMNSIQQQYLDAVPVIYLGKTDSLMFFPGKERVKLTWYVNADPKVQKTIIYWNNGSDSIVKPFTRVKQGSQKDSIIINVPAGTYLFKLINTNNDGDKSLVSNIQGTSYGESYRNELNCRDISSLTMPSDKYVLANKSGDVVIDWADATDLCVSTWVSYKKHTTGEVVNVEVLSNEEQTTLHDVGNLLSDTNNVISVSSKYIPAVGAIDTFFSPVTQKEVALYLATGTRKEYSKTGTVTSTVNYTDEKKCFTKMADGVFYCDRFANSAATVANTLFRIVIEKDNTIFFSGNYNGLNNLISNIDGMISTYDPVTRVFNLKYKQVATNGTYTYVEEILSPW